MLENKKYPTLIDKKSHAPIMEDEQDAEDQSRAETALKALVRLVVILNTISENKKNQGHTIGYLDANVDVLFNNHLRKVIMNGTNAHAAAIKMQESFWDLYGGYTLEILRLKCIMIGYNPDIFVDGKDPKYPEIQL